MDALTLWFIKCGSHFISSRTVVPFRNALQGLCRFMFVALLPNGTQEYSNISNKYPRGVEVRTARVPHSCVAAGCDATFQNTGSVSCFFSGLRGDLFCVHASCAAARNSGKRLREHLSSICFFCLFLAVALFLDLCASPHGRR
jgi:hypothetical protein